MASIRRTVAITVLTNGSGDGTGYSIALSGRLCSIRYVKTDFDNGVDFVVTGETTGIELLTKADCNASATFHPRAQLHDVADGAGLTYDGTRKQVEQVRLYKERVKIVVAQGGNAKTGTFYVTVE